MGGLIHIGAWDGREYLGDERELLLFEPQADAFRRLVRNLGEMENAILVNVALGAKGGTAKMHKAEPDDSSSLLAPKKQLDIYPKIKFSGKMETVRVMTLDSVMRSRGLKGLYDEMVIDVQGYELEVLKGAKRTLPDIRRIKCEVNTDEVYEGCALMEEIDAFLEPFGFTRTELELHTGGICGDAIYAK